MSEMTTKETSGLSLVVQMNDGVNLSVKSDLEKLTEGQTNKLRDFLKSVVYPPRQLIKEVNNYPYVVGIDYGKRAYPVGQNSNYEG